MSETPGLSSPSVRIDFENYLMSAWLRGQKQPQRPGPNPRKSATYNGFMAIQGQCQEQIARLFELLNTPDSQAMVGGVTKEMAFQRAAQRKNECFARALCPSEMGAAFDCVVDPERAAGGDCDMKLEAASSCAQSFWEGALNPSVAEGMQRYSECAESCSQQLEAQQRCVRKVGPQRAAVVCGGERRAAELCLGSCLAPEEGQKWRACEESGGTVEQCRPLADRVVAARGLAGRKVLLDMGFAEGDLTAQETSDSLMDLVGMIIFTSVVEDRQGM